MLTHPFWLVSVVSPTFHLGMYTLRLLREDPGDIRKCARQAEQDDGGGSDLGAHSSVVKKAVRIEGGTIRAVI